MKKTTYLKPKSARRKPVRRHSLRLLVQFLAALVLAGCSSLAAQPPPPADLVIAAPEGDVAEVVEAVAAGYGPARVRVETYGSEAYLDQIGAALLAGLDRYDLVYLPADQIARWAAYRTLRPLAIEIDGQPARENQDLAPWLPAVMVEGELYGLPTQPEPDVLWYRADLLEAAGIAPPRDMVSLRAAALALSAPPERYGIALAGSELDAGQDFDAILAGFGGRAVSAGYQVELGGEAARAALDWIAGLVHDGHAVLPRSDRLMRGKTLEALAGGRVAMAIGPLNAGKTLLDCADNSPVCQDGRPLLAWTWLPGLDERVATGAAGAWAVPLRAAHPAEAERFAGWLGSLEGAQAWAQNGGLPAHRAALAGLGAEGQALARVEEYRPAFPPLPLSESLWKAYHAAAHQVIAGKRNPEDVLPEAAATMQSVLRQARD